MIEKAVRLIGTALFVLIAGLFVLTGNAPVWVWAGCLGCAAILWFVFEPKALLKLGGKCWDEKDFCRGWLITGTTGCGKTVAAINNMLWQVTRNCPNWGGVCIDEKGVFWETLLKVFERCGRKDDLVLLKVPEDIHGWEPKHTLNFLSIDGITLNTHAKIIVDTAKSLGQGNKGDGFFATQAQIQIAYGLMALSKSKIKPLSYSALYEMFQSDAELNRVLQDLEFDESTEAAQAFKHFNEEFLTQPREQRGGVISTILNYLSVFANDSISSVFCTPKEDKTNFDFANIDNGKVVCLSIPQKFSHERRYINTILKFCFYSHALRRFDLTASERRDKNLLILWADEAQKVLTANDDGMSDYNIVDVIREAKATVVAATQSFSSLVPPLGMEKSKVFVANMANRVNFKAADEDSAVAIANAIGKRKVLRKGSPPSEEYRVSPSELRGLRQFQAVIQHCEKGFVKKRLKPRFF